MIPKFNLTILFVLSAFSLYSQESFTWFPNDTLVQNLPKDAYTEMKIEQVRKNKLDTLELSVEIVESTIPKSWDGLVCVYGLCLGSIPEPGKKYDMSPNWGSADNAYVRLTLNPMGRDEKAIYRVRVFNKKNPKDGDTATWIINPKKVNIPKVSSAQKMSISPNPASDFVKISSFNGFSSLLIFDLAGKRIFEQKNFTEDTILIDLRSWKRGVYFVQLVDNANILVSQKLMVYE